MTGTDPTMPAPRGTGQTSALDERGGPDLLTLIVGLAALGIAVATLLGGMAWLPSIDGRWLLAVLALIVGLLLVIGSLRPDKAASSKR
jgi:membrane protein implicated in regulation of membrane protease activity